MQGVRFRKVFLMMAVMVLFGALMALAPNSKTPPPTNPPLKFRFLASLSDEDFESRDLPEGQSLYLEPDSKYNMGGESLATILQNSANPVLLDEHKYQKIDSPLIRESITDKQGDEYTVLAKGHPFNYVCEGIYYFNGEYRDEILVRIVPKILGSHPQIPPEGAQFIIVQKPHPLLKSVRWNRIHEPKQMTVATPNKEHFRKDFAAHLATETFDHCGSRQIGEFQGPFAFEYLSEDNRQRYLAVSWQDSKDDMCFYAALYEDIPKEGKHILKQRIGYRSEIGQLNLMGSIRLNNRQFVLINVGGWEWGSEEIWEILPAQGFWLERSSSSG